LLENFENDLEAKFEDCDKQVEEMLLKINKIKFKVSDKHYYVKEKNSNLKSLEEEI
jgi:hypothetical protein